MRIAVAGSSGAVGRHVVAEARARGHEVVSISRLAGVDVLGIDDLSAALDGAEAIIDVLNIETTSQTKATAFFINSTANLQRAGTIRKVRRLVTLSIVGIDRVPGFGYYQAKLAQEDAARKGPIPATIVRATQFHEFAIQMLARARIGPLVLVPRMSTQPVAARSLGAVLVDIATAEAPVGEIEVAGPEKVDMVKLTRRVARRNGKWVGVLPLWLPGEAGRTMRSGALLPRDGARIVGPDTATWLATTDALIRQ